MRIRRAYAEELAARAERAERDREREADRAVAAERARIARELHDVIAHHLSVMVIQAGAARRLLDTAPDQARGALATVEDAGRRGLEAVPGLLRALRADDRPDGLAPPPTLAELDSLVARVAAVGLPVELAHRGHPPAAAGHRRPVGLPGRPGGPDQHPALVRTGLRLVLEAEPDIEVVGEAADGRQAVEAARLRPDLFLMDIRMPNMDGIEATRRLAGPGSPTPCGCWC